MDSIDFDAWQTDVDNGRAVHASGFKLSVEGDVRNPCSVAPADYPPGLSYADQARLLRCGMQALASAPSNGTGHGYRSNGSSHNGAGHNSTGQNSSGPNDYHQNSQSTKATQIKTRARRAEESAKLFAERKDRPERPRLSLKK